MSTKKTRKATQKTHILSDHEKVGTRFIPPLLQIGPLSEIKYIDSILPELLWLAILSYVYGLSKGAELALTLSKLAIHVDKSGEVSPRKWFALTSSYNELTVKQKMQILESLQLTDDLELLKHALSQLVVFYPDCPLNFLFEGHTPKVENPESSLDTFKVFLSTLFDKYDTPSTLMQANAIYIAFVTDLLKVAEGLALANFPAVINFPATEESRRVAAGIRAAVNGLFGNYSHPGNSSWPNYFWNMGLELEPCNYHEIYETYE